MTPAQHRADIAEQPNDGHQGRAFLLFNTG
jgi:hypothetical protein